MENNKKLKDKSTEKIEYDKIAKNTLYELSFHYGSHFFTLLYSFFLARLFNDEIWGFLILANSYITIVVIITTLLPPGMSLALNYYIPRHITLNEKAKLKSLLKHSLILKLTLLVPVFIISVIVFYAFADLFSLTLEYKLSLLYLLSPLIIIISLTNLLTFINRGFNKFNYNFIFLIIREAIYTIPLIIFYVLKINATIEVVAIIMLISYLIPFILNALFNVAEIVKIKSTDEKGGTFKEDIAKITNYGSYTGLNKFIDRIWKETQLQGIGAIRGSKFATGYNIALNYQLISDLSVTSFSNPLLTSLTSLNVKENYELVNRIYKISYKITLFLLLFISGVLFFSVEFVIDFFFLEDRLIYSNFLRLIILASIFTLFDRFIGALLSAQNRVKLVLLMKVTYMLYYIPLFFIGLIYFGVEGAIIGLLIGNIISLIIQIILTYKLAKINLNLIQLISQYAAFFIPLAITILLKDYLFKDASSEFILNFGLTVFKNFDFLSIGTFILLFIITNLILRVVNDTDITNLIGYFDKDKKFDRLIIKGLNLVKKFTRE